MLELSIKPIMVMFDLLTKSWLWQQLLMTWCVPNKPPMVLHSNTYYAVPTALCSDAVTKKGAKV